MRDRCASVQPAEEGQVDQAQDTADSRPRVVINSDQARHFLAAVACQGPRGQRLAAFFGCLYYGALRPEEAIDLRR